MGRWVTPDTAATAKVYRRCLCIPAEYRQAVTGALYPLTVPGNWEQLGDITPQEAADAMLEMFIEYTEGVCRVDIGEVRYYATADLPDGVLPCDGGTYDRVDYPDLYDALDTAFIVDADHFTTPALAGYSVVGHGLHPDGVNRGVGDIYGEHEHTLTVPEIPPHTHSYNEAFNNDIDLEAAGVPQPAIAFTLPAQTGSTGGGNPHNVTGPRVVLRPGIIAR